MTRFKLGRKPFLLGPRNMKAMSVVNAVLATFGPPPPASQDFWPLVQAAGGFRMFLNDVLGCCTAADSCNSMIWRSAAAGNPIIPTDADALAEYEATSGYRPKNPANPQTNASDQGAVESDVCDYLVKTGLRGHKAEATAPMFAGTMDTGTLDRLRWAIIIFGCVRGGFDLPNSAQDQFAAGLPFTVSGDLTIEGGHDFPLISYDPTYFYGATWAGRPAIDPKWLLRFCEELHVEAWSIWVRPSGWTPTGFKDATMIRDLQALATA